MQGVLGLLGISSGLMWVLAIAIESSKKSVRNGTLFVKHTHKRRWISGRSKNHQPRRLIPLLNMLK